MTGATGNESAGRTRVERLDSDALDEGAVAELGDVLHACVDGGASVGFVPPFGVADARRYWRDVRGSLVSGGRVLLVARQDGRITGTAQVMLAMPANGRHRADVGKVLVHPAARRSGLGRALMAEVERVALEHGRSLLVLDTVTDSAGERLYQAIGYRAAGVIPGYALSTRGTLEDTRVMFKVLPPISG
ncbi:GNAT family N-acetyltransferase [Micromonospora sp. NBC_01699]|uniref:GNAT family N-acetyltransferase n=1 Tax=Micromonospora sp. NBC_01699 TaxID=2975984 RepID=UPI002E2883EC|nr:GNAT family N-acetyltransferase [Micromonospora sp. NBC_01699]